MIKIIYKEKPKCKTCGKEMKEWYAFQEEFEHSECIIKRLSENMIKTLKKSLK